MPLAMLAYSVSAFASHDHVLDDFEELKGWGATSSAGTSVEIAQDAGHRGMGMRIDFDSQNGPGYAIVQKTFTKALPENYAISFSLRAQAPTNNFELKLLDPSGKNVWWYNQRDYEFPGDWRQLVVKKRHFNFAWGPSGGTPLKQVGAIEFAISMGSGGKGSIWIDDLRFEKREPAVSYQLKPAMSASTSSLDHGPALIMDGDPATTWRSGAVAESQWLLIDFLKNREMGGLVIDWDRDDYATAYQVQTSDDGVDWKLVHTVSAGNGERDYVYMPDAEARYLRLDLQKSSRNQGYAIPTITVKPFEFSASINQFFESIARDAPRGTYPRYFYGEQAYWTIVGVDGDDHEALLNEDGTLEVDGQGFTIEPFLYSNGKLITWNDVQPTPSLESGYLPIPSVGWQREQLGLKVTAFAHGEPGAPVLYANYRVTNNSTEHRHVNLYLTLRPFQVNPPWQNLNTTGGVSPIRELKYADGAVSINQGKVLNLFPRPDKFGAASFEQGSVTDYLVEGKLPDAAEVDDAFGYASGAMEYNMDLPGGASKDIIVAIPYHHTMVADPTVPAAKPGSVTPMEASVRYWENKLNRLDLDLPPEAADIISTLKSTLAYIFINRDKAAIQPGSRSYARSWIRDGALTSAALLEMGYTEEVREFIKWYTTHQTPDGKVPCCVDRRGADGVPENDSNGEFIYLVAEYYRYTRDVGFLKELWPYVVRATEYIDHLRGQRRTDDYKTQDKLAYYGLVPESISHEGYSSQPVHSYWDNFWVLRGLKDAAYLAVVLGDDARAPVFAALRDSFKIDLFASIAATQAQHKLDFLPASVELGDFDPTSTAIAIAPLGESGSLAAAPLARTFERYFEIFSQRQSGQVSSEAYTPYELRNVAVLTRLGQRSRALDALNFFLRDRRPQAWNQWAEVVWRDPKMPRFIGDMPHTWVGSEFIRAVRSLLVYERESDQALVLAAGLPNRWIDSERGVAVRGLPTYYGTLNYQLSRVAPGALRLRLTGDIMMPPGKIILAPELPADLIEVTINGAPTTTFDAKTITIPVFPADVVLRYAPSPAAGESLAVTPAP
jgi:hypothetical protein